MDSWTKDQILGKKSHLKFGPPSYKHSEKFLKKCVKNNLSFFDIRTADDQTKNFDLGYDELKQKTHGELADFVTDYRKYYVEKARAKGQDKEKMMGQAVMKSFEMFQNNSMEFMPANEMPLAPLLLLAGAYRWRLVKMEYGTNGGFYGYFGPETDQNPFYVKVDQTGAQVGKGDGETTDNYFMNTSGSESEGPSSRSKRNKKRGGLNQSDSLLGGSFSSVNMEEFGNNLIARLKEQMLIDAKEKDERDKQWEERISLGIQDGFKHVKKVTDALVEDVFKLKEVITSKTNSDRENPNAESSMISLTSNSNTLKYANEEIEFLGQNFHNFTKDIGSKTENRPSRTIGTIATNKQASGWGSINGGGQGADWSDQEGFGAPAIKDTVLPFIDRNNAGKSTTTSTGFRSTGVKRPDFQTTGYQTLIDGRNGERNAGSRSRVRTTYPMAVGRLKSMPVRNDPFKKPYNKQIPPDILATIECWYCKVKGHKIQDCPMKQPDKCHVCGEVGHLKVDCPVYLKRKKMRGFRTDGNQTFRREESGHLVAISHGLKDIEFTNPELGPLARNVAPVVDAFFVAADHCLEEKRIHTNTILKRDFRKYLPNYMDMDCTVFINRIEKSRIEQLDKDEDGDPNELPIKDNLENLEKIMGWVANDTGLETRKLIKHYRRMEWRESPNPEAEEAPLYSARIEFYERGYVTRILDKFKNRPHREADGELLGQYYKGLTQQELNNDQTEQDKVDENNRRDRENAKRQGLDPPAEEQWSLVGREGSRRCMQKLTEQQRKRREAALADKPKKSRKRELKFSPTKISPPTKLKKGENVQDGGDIQENHLQKNSANSAMAAVTTEGDVGQNGGGTGDQTELNKM